MTVEQAPPPPGLVYILGWWREVSTAPLMSAVVLTARPRAQTRVAYIADDAGNVMYGVGVSAATDPEGRALLTLVWVEGAVYDVEFGGVKGTLRCDDWPEGSTVPFTGIRGIPGGDGIADPLTWDAVISGLNGRIAAQVAPAVRTELPGALTEQLADPGSTMSQALAEYVPFAATIIKAHRYGVRAGTGTPQNTALHAAFVAAKNAGGAATVELPPGIITIEGTFALDGYSAGLRGAGGGNLAGVGATGSVIKCINQTGPVLDFTGFKWPADMIGRIVFEGFTIQGDGTADPTKTKTGIYSPPNENPIGYTFRDLTIRRTGGPCILIHDTYFGLWENVTLCDPVAVVANDVPYGRVVRGNGTVYINVGLRSQVYSDAATHPGDVGASGAFILDAGDDLAHVYTRGVMLGCWAENLHVPSGGTIVASGTMSVAHRDWSFFDCFKVKDGTATSFIRFTAQPPSAAGNARHGGNSVTGVIEGRTIYHASGFWIDHGVRDSQGGNLIDGTKGWGGNNVLLDAGINYTTVELKGGERPLDVPGWVDNSGTTTNTLIDSTQGIYIYGGRSGQRREYVRTGSPEGVIAAPIGSTCTDPTAALGVAKWVKNKNVDAFGWEAVRGNTGKRVLTAALLNGWTDNAIQRIAVRRVGDVVTLSGRITRGTADQLLDLPVGFRADDVVWAPVLYGSITPPLTTAPLQVISGAVYLPGIGDNEARVYATWTTKDPWPTTLPGVAA